MLQKMLSGMIIEEWARATEAQSSESRPLLETSPLAAELGQNMLALLEGTAASPKSYFEMGPPLARLMAECTALMQGFVTQCKVAREKVPAVPQQVDIDTSAGADTFTIETARTIVNTTFAKTKEILGRTKKKEVAVLEERRKKIVESIAAYDELAAQHDFRIAAAYAAAVIALHLTPTQLSPIIKGLMNGIKVSYLCTGRIPISPCFCSTRRTWTCNHVRPLHLRPSSSSAPCTTWLGHQARSSRIVATFLCSDTEFVPVFETNIDVLDAVLSFKKDSAPAAVPAKAIVGTEREPGKLSKSAVARRGAQFAFSKMSLRFADRLFDSVPKLWSSSRSTSLTPTVIPVCPWSCQTAAFHSPQSQTMKHRTRNYRMAARKGRTSSIP